VFIPINARAVLDAIFLTDFRLEHCF